jgi:hypothetical protein
MSDFDEYDNCTCANCDNDFRYYEGYEDGSLLCRQCKLKEMSLTKEQIEAKYQELCNTESDIFMHLPTLRKYADECKIVTEFGTRSCVSLFAFLASKAERVIAVDILNVAVPSVDKLTFICADDLQIEIEPTDFLFIDTAHNYKQLIQELNLHAKNVKKYIAFHDTYIFGEHGDDGGNGLNYAIREFLAQDEDWQVCYHTDVNNGLTIIERIK